MIRDLLLRIGIVILPFGLALLGNDSVPDGLKAPAILLLAIAGGAVFYRDYQPSHRVTQASAETIIHIFLLPALVSGYKDKVPGDYDLRACVMRAKLRLVIHGRRPVLTKVGKIEFSTSGFTTAERDLIWEKGVGATGGAIAEKEFTVWDRDRLPRAAGGMSPTHAQLTLPLRSVLAAPIFRSKDKALSNVVGVIALDSKSPIELTHFDEKQNHGIVGTIASLIGDFLP